jgi:hypothetical protein
MRNIMRSKSDAGMSYLFIGVGLGVLAGFLLASRSRPETWEELRRGAGEGLDYLSREGEKVHASADEFVGKTRDWLARIGKSLYAAKGRNANSGESPAFD